MDQYLKLALLAVVAGAIVSFLAFQLSARALPSSPRLQQVGVKLYRQKFAQLKRPPLQYYQSMVDRGAFWPGFMIIFPLILLKSLITFVAGLIAVFVLPLSMATMPALAAQHSARHEVQRWITQVAVIQGASHLCAAAAGFALTWLWLSEDLSPLTVACEQTATTGIFLGASLLTALWAGWLETDGHIRRGYLDSDMHQTKGNS